MFGCTYFMCLFLSNFNKKPNVLCSYNCIINTFMAKKLKGFHGINYISHEILFLKLCKIVIYLYPFKTLSTTKRNHFVLY